MIKNISTAVYLKLNIVIKREGLLGFFKLAAIRIKNKILPTLVSPLILPIVFFILIIRPWCHIRFIRLYSDRIGHYAMNTEVFLCLLDKYRPLNKKFCKTFFYTIPHASLCNTQLHRMWKRIIWILPFPYFVSEINKYLMCWSKQYRSDELKKYFEIDDGFDQWNFFGTIKKCHAYFTPVELKRGKKLLTRLGVPHDAKFVCLLGRDSRYLSVYKPHFNTSHHDYRNVDITSYQLAARYLAEKGFYVIRMGKYVEGSFEVGHPNVIDYANNKLHSDFMDIYLSAHCYFFMSVGSGLDSIAQIFRRPLLLTNFPLANPGVWPDWKLFIPKKIFIPDKGRYMTFKETYDMFYTKQSIDILKILKEKNLVTVDNTPEEILDATQEMLNFLVGTDQYDHQDQILQKNFWRNFHNRFSEDKVLNMPVFKYVNIDTHVRIGRQFLKKNKELLL